MDNPVEYPFTRRKRRGRVAGGRRVWRWAGANGLELPLRRLAPQIRSLRRPQAHR